MKEKIESPEKTRDEALKFLESARKCIENLDFVQGKRLIKSVGRTLHKRILAVGIQKEGLLKKAAEKLIARNPKYAGYYDAAAIEEIDGLGIDGILFKKNGSHISLQAKSGKRGVRIHYEVVSNEKSSEARKFHPFIMAIEIPDYSAENEDAAAEELSRLIEKIAEEIEKDHLITPLERYKSKMFPYENY